MIVCMYKLMRKRERQSEQERNIFIWVFKLYNVGGFVNFDCRMLMIGN